MPTKQNDGTSVQGKRHHDRTCAGGGGTASSGTVPSSLGYSTPPHANLIAVPVHGMASTLVGAAPMYLGVAPTASSGTVPSSLGYSTPPTVNLIAVPVHSVASTLAGAAPIHSGVAPTPVGTALMHSDVALLLYRSTKKQNSLQLPWFFTFLKFLKFFDAPWCREVDVII